MVPMSRFTYTVRFLTPALLRDAEQHGRWRTPPLKALLRLPAVGRIKRIVLAGHRFKNLFDDLGVQGPAGMKRQNDALRALGINPVIPFRAELGKSGLQQHRFRLRCR